jgi:hypothetical protein
MSEASVVAAVRRWALAECAFDRAYVTALALITHLPIQNVW